MPKKKNKYDRGTIFIPIVNGRTPLGEMRSVLDTIHQFKPGEFAKIRRGSRSKGLPPIKNTVAASVSNYPRLRGSCTLRDYSHNVVTVHRLAV